MRFIKPVPHTEPGGAGVPSQISPVLCLQPPPRAPGPSRPHPASRCSHRDVRSCSTLQECYRAAVATEGMVSAQRVRSDGSDPSAGEQGGDAHPQGCCLPVSHSALPKNELEIGMRGELQGELGCSTLLSGGSADKHEIPHFSGTHADRARTVGLLAAEIKPTPGKRD